MALSVLVMQAIALFDMSHSLNVALNATNVVLNASVNTSNGNAERRNSSKPLLLSTSSVFYSNNETNTSSIWNLAHYSNKEEEHHDHFTGSSTVLVITVFIGFTLAGLFLLWRRHRYANREVICHYTTLNQEVTLPPSDEIINELNDEQEFHLDLSDDLASSSDDEELLR